MSQTAAPDAAANGAPLQHPIAKLLMQQSSVGNVRVSIHKDYWPELKNVQECPMGEDSDLEGPDQAMCIALTLV